MVLVSNEWLNNKDDEQKPATTETTTLSNSTTIGASDAGPPSQPPLALNSHQQQQQQIADKTKLMMDDKNKKEEISDEDLLLLPDKDQDQDKDKEMAREKHESETRERDQQGDSGVIIDNDIEMNSTNGANGATPQLNTPVSQSQSQSQLQLKLEVDNNNFEEYLSESINQPPPLNSSISPGSMNISPCDSNTNTLQSIVGQRQVAPQLTQQTLHMALNSVINANNATTTNMPSSASNLYTVLALNNGALQQQQQQQQLQLQEVLSAGNCSTLLVSSHAPPPAEMDNSLGMDSNGEAKIVLHCEPKSHKFETRSIQLPPNQECKVGRLIAKSKAAEGNAIFDCKVLSRNHAILWYTPDGHFWVKDTKSSNGTFINDNKLGSDAAELRYGDCVKFGVEVIENSRQEVHGCIIARVTLFLPDGREAISIEQDAVQLAGPNRISYDEIQRLNGFMQEAAQREKMLKAKLSSLQNVLDSTRKNSAMCWQSMITEDQLLHKINLLEKKLQMMEKNVPDNALRNEIVKLLEDKTSYQLTAKEALRKVYQERCDAMQMLSKMETAYATSENECTILRAQILNSKQTLHDFNIRLEQLQLEYMEYKKESVRQQQEAKEQEELHLQQLTEQLCANERESEELRLQLALLQQNIAERNSEQKLQEQQAMARLDAAIADMDDEDDDEDDNDNENDVVAELENIAGQEEERLRAMLGQEKRDGQPEQEKPQPESNGGDVTTASHKKSAKKKKGKKNKQERDRAEFDLKNKVVRKSTVMKWLKNSDLDKGEGGLDLFKAIYNDSEDDDSAGEAELEREQQRLIAACELSAGASSPAASGHSDADDQAQEAGDEFVHNVPPYYERLNGSHSHCFDETEEQEQQQHHKLQTQATLINSDAGVSMTALPPELPPEQAMEMLEVELNFYRQKTTTLTSDISLMQDQMELLKQQLEQQMVAPIEEDNKRESQDTASGNGKQQQSKDFERELAEDLASMNNAQMEREEELIVYKERLEQSESSNLLLRNEISVLRLKQQPLPAAGNQLVRRALPLGCMALAALVYFLSSRF